MLDLSTRFYSCTTLSESSNFLCILSIFCLWFWSMMWDREERGLPERGYWRNVRLLEWCVWFMDCLLDGNVAAGDLLTPSAMPLKGSPFYLSFGLNIIPL